MRRVTATFLPIESRPFVTADFDFTREALADGTSFEDELFGAAHLAAFKAKVPVDGAVIRVRYRATSDQQRRIDVSLVRSALLDAGAHVVKIEPDIVREDRARVDGVDEDLAPLDAYDLWATANEVDPTLAARARERMSVLLEQVA